VPPAVAQDEGADAGVLVIMDSSLSMDEPAGGGPTRMEAAKRAVSEVMGGLPEDAQVGLRVYGARVNESSRAEGCRDSELVAPVQTGGAAGVNEAVQALEPKGRTPIGRSLRAAPEDLEGFERKTVVLVSDGGDNCAPPDPCEAAQEVAQQGVALTINVVGLQVTERVREQLRCIADAGGGLYSDAQDPDDLLDELRAALARAFRAYEPSGRPVRGGPDPGRATPLEDGAYLDRLGPGQSKWYRVEVSRAQQLYAAAVAVVDRQTNASGAFGVEILPPGEDSGPFTQDALGIDSVLGRIDARAVRTGVIGLDPEAGSPGTFLIRVYRERTGGQELPVEVLVKVSDANEAPDTTSADPGRPGPDEPADEPPPPGEPGQEESSDGEGMLPWLGLVGIVALAAGGTGGWKIARRREDR
jgi:Ca-activated chloride channel family protein